VVGGRVHTSLVNAEVVSVRSARPADAAAMRELATAAYQLYVDRIGREPAPMTADYDRIADSGHAWVAEEEGRIVGLLVLAGAEDHLLIENVAVAPTVQGRGVGRRLLQLAEEQARAYSVREGRLYTHEMMTENLAYYPRRGYRETHRASENGFRRVFFTKVLA